MQERSRVIETALSGYEHQDYAELITLVTAQTSVGKFAKTRMRDAYANGEYEVVQVS